QRQRELRLRVRLGEDRRGGLLQDRVAGQVGGLVGHVHVADAALGGGQVLAHVLRVRQGAAEAVLGGAGRSARGPDRVDRRAEGRDGGLRVGDVLRVE